MSLIARAPSNLERSYEIQSPWSAKAEEHDRTGTPGVGRDTSHERASYSEWNICEAWSSQEWKSDELMEVRTGRLVYD